jgi:hypothetical protein
MARWRAFVDVLDEMLREPDAAPPAATASYRPSYAAHPASPFYGFTVPTSRPNRFWSMPGPYRQGQPTATTDAESAPPTPDYSHVVGMAVDDAVAPEPRVARSLKPAEKLALQTLVRLGAALDGRFTARELRSAFRALAQRYHPDRHPHVTEAERSRLSATFAEVTSAYGVLSGTFQ